VDLGSARLARRSGVDDRRQHLVVDDDLLRGVLSLRQRLRDDGGDMVADVAHLALRQRRMRPDLHRRAVLREDRPAADQAADLVGGKVVAGEHGDHAGHASRLRRVELGDLGVRMRRAQEIRVSLAGAVQVVDVLALAGDEAKIFLAAN